MSVICRISALASRYATGHYRHRGDTQRLLRRWKGSMNYMLRNYTPAEELSSKTMLQTRRTCHSVLDVNGTPFPRRSGNILSNRHIIVPPICSRDMRRFSQIFFVLGRSRKKLKSARQSVSKMISTDSVPSNG